MITSRSTFAGLPPCKITRENAILAVKFVVVHGCELVTTKLNVVPLFGASAGRSFVPPITQRLDWPTIFPWASSRKQMARADSTLSARLFVIASDTMAFCPITFGGVTVTANCADTSSGQNTTAAKRKNFIPLFLHLFNGVSHLVDEICKLHVVRFQFTCRQES